MKLNSKVYNAAMKMEEAAFNDGALSKKHKELIALGIGVITDCKSCMQWHMEQAVQAGATQQEIIETLEVAIEMGVVPATVHARFALEIMDSLFARSHVVVRPHMRDSCMQLTRCGVTAFAEQNPRRFACS